MVQSGPQSSSAHDRQESEVEIGNAKFERCHAKGDEGDAGTRCRERLESESSL